jgi:prepilin-type N-terminal cleavage/methylation domain-containing protein
MNMLYLTSAHNQRLMANNDGYTLLEVMVALLIVAMSLGAVFQNISQSNRTAVRSELTLKAVRLAHNIFNDTELINAIMRDQIIEEQIPGQADWQYRFFAEPLVIETFLEDEPIRLEIKEVRKIILCIFYGPQGNQQSFCFEKWRRP